MPSAIREQDEVQAHDHDHDQSMLDAGTQDQEQIQQDEKPGDDDILELEQKRILVVRTLGLFLALE